MKAPRQSHVPRKKPHDTATPEDLSAEILGFLAADTDRMTRFFDLTGLTSQTVRAAAAQPEFRASLFDYLAGDERLLIAFAAETGRDPDEVISLHHRFASQIDGNG